MSLQVFDYDKEQEELNNNSEEDEDQIEHFNSFIFYYKNFKKFKIKYFSINQ